MTEPHVEAASADGGTAHQHGKQRRACHCRRLPAIHFFLTTWIVMMSELVAADGSVQEPRLRAAMLRFGVTDR